MAKYVTMTPRLVTPIYPADANFIVSMLDIHVSPSLTAPKAPTLEILEAGTGHGALTLYLARAIHTANPRSLETGRIKEDEDHVGESIISNAQEPREGSAVEGSRKSEVNGDSRTRSCPGHNGNRRGAVIHTVDIAPQYSRNARQMVKGFHQGMYRNDIEFHVGDVSDWIDQQFGIRGIKPEETFLSHIVLNMPAAQHHVEKAASALHVNGSLLAFNPSITQIISIAQVIKRRFLPLYLDRVVELGHNLTGGREWDVRMIRPKAWDRAEMNARPTNPDADDGEEVAETAHEDIAREQQDRIEPVNTKDAQAPVTEGDGYHTICRPKVVERYVGGGFLGVWKKMKK